MVDPLDALAPALLVASLVVLIATLRARPWRITERSATGRIRGAEVLDWNIVEDSSRQPGTVREPPAKDAPKERRAGAGDDS